MLTSWNEHHVKNNFGTPISNERGSMIATSILVLVVVALTGMTVIKTTAADQIESAYDVSAQKAVYLAQSGLEHAANQIYHGDNPVLNNANLLDGQVSVAMNPTTKKITSKGTFGNSTKTFTQDGEFAADCVSVDFGPAIFTQHIGAADWSHLEEIHIKKTCDQFDTIKVKEVRLLFSAPNFTKLVKRIGVNDDTTLYHVPSALVPGYPDVEETGTPDSGAQSKQVIDVTNYAFNNNGLRKMDVWWNTSFTGTTVPLQVEVDFVDGSVYTSAVKNLP